MERDIFISAETRWFFPGQVPEAMADWFACSSVEASSPERTDDYLLLPGCSTAGVKLREGHFEVKAITGPSEVYSWSDDIAGKRDTWVKWSVKVSEPRLLAELSAGDDATWLPVVKQRDLRLVSLDGPTPGELQPNTIRLRNGCQFELTRIHLGSASSDPWWSLSFEAFGPAGSVMRNLGTAMHFVLADPPPVPLPAANSMSYPQWLLDQAESSPA